MIISTNLLNKAMQDRADAQQRHSEGYDMLEYANAGMSLGFATGFLVIAVVFAIMELLVLFYAITIAYKCSKGHERIVHLVLATVFTFPYVLLMLLFNKCAPTTLANL
jgi:hypothetical protein